MRKPSVKNKYHLSISKIRKLQVGDRSKISSPLFWRNDVIGAWCITGVADPENEKWGDESSYWIGIYDEDAKAYAGKFRFSFETYGGMCSYRFTEFFQEKDIEQESDLVLQEMFLKKINDLIDDGILEIPE